MPMGKGAVLRQSYCVRWYKWQVEEEEACSILNQYNHNIAMTTPKATDLVDDECKQRARAV